MHKCFNFTSKTLHLVDARSIRSILWAKSFNFNLSGNEGYYTARSSLVVESIRAANFIVRKF